MQVLARKAGIDRGTAYHVAQTLRGKGLFTLAQEGTRPMFRAAHPQELFNYMQARKEEADEHFSALQEMFNDLVELYEVGA